MSLLVQQSRTGWKHYRYGNMKPRGSLRRCDSDESVEGKSQYIVVISVTYYLRTCHSIVSIV